MKTERIIFVLFAMFALSVNAQSDYSSYLNKAMEKLEAGDCESAQKFYNVYKDLSGESKSSVQILIDDCKKSKRKLHYLGDTINVDGKAYIVVSLSDDGKHGIAVFNKGKGKLTNKLIDDHLIPSIEELYKIRENKELIGVYDWCWSYDWVRYDESFNEHRYAGLDFNSNKSAGSACKSWKERILLIHRF